MAGNPEKARKYLALLDEARCNDRWGEVTELARKISKHAPQRQCLVETARIEAELAQRNSARPLKGVLSEDAVKTLRNTITQHGASSLEDAYQARALIAQNLWAAEKKDEALRWFEEEIPPPESGDGKEKRRLQGWTYVVAIRSAYLKELCLASPDEQGTRHETLFVVLDTASANIQKSDEYCSWLEKLLMRMCLKRPKRPIWMGSDEDKRTTERLLAPFRAWLRCWDLVKDRRPPTVLASEDGSRRDAWGAYYSTLSQLLRSGYIYPSSSVALFSKAMGHKSGDARLAQSLEILRAEAIYEELLLKETSFPEASRYNKDIDDCADQVLENWSILCGPSWQEGELGQGGREALSRHVLDFLYRASTRTYHSCAILRHLFAVHATLGEFQLATKALDSYLEIVLKGRARAEKSGKSEPALDKDELIVQTIVNAVEMLTSYGKLEQALRAEQLCGMLQDWLTKHEKTSFRRSHVASGYPEPKLEQSLRSSTLALIHRAIGMSKANWARYTLAPSERTTLQSEAVRHLRQSLMCEGASLEDPQTLYALALVLAETRDTEGAIATAKHALSTHSQLKSDGTETDTLEQHNRTLTTVGVVQCWHLLALLLSARQDFEKAEAACEAAFESFDDDEFLTRAGKLKQLNFFKKQQMVQIKLTQAALLELNSNLDDAIGAGSESLRLYAYLFPAPEKKEPQEMSKPAGGSLRQRGSLFHRKKGVSDSNPASTGPPSVYSYRISEDTTRPPTVSGVAEGASLAPAGASQHPQQKLHKRPSQRSVHRERPYTATTISTIPSLPSQINGVETTGGKGGVGVAISNDLPIAIASQLEGITKSHLPPLILENSHFNEHPFPRPPQKIPYPPLPPRLSREVEEQYSLGLLSSIWVFISGLYRRAGLYDDSVGAIEEAFKLIERVEQIVARTNSSARKFEEPGWGSAKSVEQLWADAHSASAYLHLAQQHPQEAVSKFETALSFFPDHPVATVGLSNLLLDIYSHKVAKPGESIGSTSSGNATQTAAADSSNPVLSPINALQHGSTHRRTASSTEAFPSLSPSDPAIAVARVSDAPENQTITTGAGQTGKPKDLDRLAARDRAFGLLSSLTRLGTSWDDSEAWFALARAYEESGQPDKARDVLWWVVELEEKKPVRNWICLGQSYTC